MEFLKNDEEVQDELEALSHILESDFNYTVNEDNIICKLNIKPTDTITNLKTNLFISLIIVLSSNYPEEACMCTIEKAQGLSISSNNKNDNVIKIVDDGSGNNNYMEDSSNLNTNMKSLEYSLFQNSTSLDWMILNKILILNE